METVMQKEILQNKINNVLENNKPKIIDGIRKLDYDSKNLNDYIITLNGERPIIMIDYDDNQKLVFYDRKIGPFTLHDNAINQLSEKLNAPSKYVRDLSKGKEWEREIAQYILSHGLKNTSRSRLLLRTVGDDLRAVLSDKYRRLDSMKILTNFSQGIANQGAVIYDMYVNDIKSYIEAIHPIVYEIPTKNNGLVHTVFGMRITNSDFGGAAFDIKSYQMQVICLNGLTGETMTRQVHLGSKLPDDLQISQRTFDYDTQTQISLTNDLVKQLFSKEYIDKKVHTILKASEMEIDLDKEIKKLPKLGVTKEEISDMEKIFINNDPSDGVQGASTVFKLVQGISAVGNSKCEERKRDLHDVAGQLLTKISLN